MIRQINIKFVPQSEQQYKTVGDYWIDQEGVLQLRITDLRNPAYNFAVLIHELVERLKNIQRGITDEAVDAFDLHYEGEYSEPGLDPAAPYHQSHMEADAVERVVIAMCGEDWGEYEKVIDAQFEENEE